ncbi:MULTISPECIES: response regulator transcription factor [Anaerofustis]|uniref:response regulator transcription factor n=1 Tax=Anaerofustis TaxID=264995 RepID=UPI00110677A8|nr:MULTISPECIES: response regulator transcription factor [Anaerofustis]MCO8193317.1 response regulator transcription factor [Anaerofustis sp. NSJ-163]
MNEILLIEDELKIARFLQLELTHEGYNLTIATEGRDGLIKAMDDKFDLIILDLMLPNLSGIEICRRLRSNNIQTPIIMLTAKSDVSDKVMGLDIGADDYMTKPFAIEELLARIRKILSRSKRENEKKEKEAIIKAGKIVLNKNTYSAHFDNEEISLTKKEFELLEYLMINKNIVLTREQIVSNVWGYDYESETNVTDVYIRYLRSKIDQKYNTHYIRTVRGIGYQFKDDDEE